MIGVGRRPWVRRRSRLDPSTAPGFEPGKCSAEHAPGRLSRPVEGGRRRPARVLASTLPQSRLAAITPSAGRSVGLDLGWLPGRQAHPAVPAAPDRQRPDATMVDVPESPPLTAVPERRTSRDEPLDVRTVDRLPRHRTRQLPLRRDPVTARPGVSLRRTGKTKEQRDGNERRGQFSRQAWSVFIDYAAHVSAGPSSCLSPSPHRPTAHRPPGLSAAADQLCRSGCDRGVVPSHALVAAASWSKRCSVPALRPPRASPL